MNLLIVLKTLGVLLLCESAAMLPSILVAVIYNEDTILAFVASLLITAAAGALLFMLKAENNMVRYRESFAIVTFGWLAASILGALPFLFTGLFPSFLDAFFESISGFTTTGATVIQNVEALPYSLLFWRSFTHWLGGMGILVLALALQPALGAGTFQIFKAESPGPILAKLTPRVSDTAKILYITYLLITAGEILLLAGGGMPLFDSMIHAFGTLATGGVSSKNMSIGAYDSVYLELVVTVFMIAAGANFALYYRVCKEKNPAGFFQNTEFRIYLSVIAVYIAIITLNINGEVFDSVFTSLRYASFQVASIITTTGYTTADFNAWPDLSRALLLSLMFVGPCAGSTGGAMKMIRIYIVFRYVQREVNKLIHPRAVKSINIDDVPVQENVLSGVMAFTILYLGIFIAATVLLTTQKISLFNSAAAVAAALGNVGSGLGLVGSSGTYTHFTAFSKIILSFCMLLGRLEIYTVLSLLSPQFWKQ
ncbi:MAG: TrkH family potassium uptake protein [Firmicutes bacterium]|nr:TrkH family potassium uptake protein [Bacillota bacterium]